MEIYIVLNGDRELVGAYFRRENANNHLTILLRKGDDNSTIDTIKMDGTL